MTLPSSCCAMASTNPAVRKCASGSVAGDLWAGQVEARTKSQTAVTICHTLGCTCEVPPPIEWRHNTKLVRFECPANGDAKMQPAEADKCGDEEERRPKPPGRLDSIFSSWFLQKQTSTLWV